ncbi:MAG TPA: nuclear transport factor 2 family protein [Agromyces sp.]
MSEEPSTVAGDIRRHVDAWWRAVTSPGAGALRALTRDDVLVTGMPGRRVEGWDAMERQHAEFTSRASVDGWELSEWTERVVGPTAVCSYRWRESGTMDGEPFDLTGSATDVLVLDGDGWRLLARHVGP